MSKITKALEKAARERRLQHRDDRVTVTATAKPMRIVSTQSEAVEASRAGEVTIDPHIVSATDPSSPIAEQYRILKTNFQSLRLPTGSKVIVVTSAVHGEGKSVTSINLALTMARQERLRVLLIDADLRKGTIHRWLGLEQKEGLSTVLKRGGVLNGSLVKLQDPQLTVLPSGEYPDQPAELLESSLMRQLLATLKTQFDLIIIDSPPVIPVADPGILSAQADGVLLVVRAGKTQRKTVTQAQTMLKQAKAPMVGCVLTHVEYYLPGYYRYYYQYRYGAKTGSGHSKPTAEAIAPASPGAATASP